MRIFYSFVVGIAWCLATLTSQAFPSASHVFIISIDGGKPAVIAQSTMPNLQKLIATGAHTWRATTIFPSSTLPAHTSMLTGVLPEKHHVSWNSYIPTNGLVKVPTIFSEAKRGGLTTAMFVGKEKFRHLDTPGDVDEFDFNPAIVTMVNKQMVGEAHKSQEGTVHALTVATNAARYIIAHKPNVCFIHFTDTDDTGHKFGWGSPEQIKAFGEVDTALGLVIDAIKKARIASDSVVIVTADHGGHDKTHGSNKPEDMFIPWIVWGKDVRRNFEITLPVNTCDTTATALWLLRLPFPSVMDGMPVVSAFR